MTPREQEDFNAKHEAITYAQEHGVKFCEKYRDDLVLLMTTYADEDARNLLESLRERFYLREW